VGQAGYRPACGSDGHRSADLELETLPDHDRTLHGLTVHLSARPRGIHAQGPEPIGDLDVDQAGLRMALGPQAAVVVSEDLLRREPAARLAARAPLDHPAAV